MRKPSNSIAVRNESLVKRIREIKGDHPFWGRIASPEIYLKEDRCLK